MTKARDLADGVINTSELADGSITTAKIADGDITDAKLATGISSSKLTGALPAISGAALTGISAGLSGPRAEVFTSSGTFTVPAGVTACKVTVVGGGGGGGASRGAGANWGDTASGGGGGGGTAIKWITGLTSGATETVTVGAGGNGATAVGGSYGSRTGNSGGTSSFGSHCSATGGTGGGSSANNGAGTGGPGGVGSNGTLNIHGGNGASGFYQNTTDDAYAGGGGRPLGLTGHPYRYVHSGENGYNQPHYSPTYYTFHAGPYGGTAGPASNGNQGDDATGYGCGGGGVRMDYNDSTAVAGNGYQGFVLVEY